MEQLLCLQLSPFAPHMVEEMWELTWAYAAKYRQNGHADGLACTYDEAKTVDSPCGHGHPGQRQAEGRRHRSHAGSGQDTVVDAALELEKVRKATEGMKIVKTIYIKNRLVNLIAKPQ
jgi:leucyl-tRNA synthetase